MPKTEGTAKKAVAKKTATKKAAAPAPEPDEDLSASDWFAPIEEIVDYINVCYYGREGSAKTTDSLFIANVMNGLKAGQGKILVVNAEGGLKRKPLIKRGVDLSRVVVWPNPKAEKPIDRKVSYAGLDLVHRRVLADLMRDPESWGGVVFDSATDIHISLLDKVQAKRVQAIINKGAEADPDFIDRADYGGMGKQFRDILRKFRDLPCHFIITALERRDVDKDTGKPTYGPAVTPALQADLLGYVDIVVMTKGEDEDGPFRGLTRANSRYRAKDRFDVLPKVMVEPTFERIVKYITDELTPETDPEQERYTAKGKDLNKSKSADDDAIENDDGEDGEDE